MSIKVSIIIPVYNAGKYLQRCVGSVISQTYENIEVIIVNDASPDPSDERIGKEFARKYKNIIYVKHSANTKPGGARNTGLKLAQGDYVCFVDADDYLEPNMIEVLVNATENGRYDIVVCGYNVVDDNGNRISDPYNTPSPRIITDPANDNFFTITNPAPWNKLWKRDLFVDNNIWFPENVYFEDLATVPLVIFYAKRIKIIPNHLYNYLRWNIVGSSTVTVFSEKAIKDRIVVYKRLFKFLQDHGLWTGKYRNYFYNMILTFTKSHLKHASKLLNNSQYNKYANLLIGSIIKEFGVIDFTALE